MTTLSRRRFFQLFTTTAIALSLNDLEAKTKIFQTNTLNNKKFKRLLDAPIQIVDGSSSIDFNGDNIDLPHDILWNTDGFIQKLGGIPRPSEHHELVVVGGGISGLLASYKLRSHKPLLLEQDKVFGGNSKGERFKDSTYSIGAAYVTIPDEGDDLDLFYKETGLHQKFRHETDKETRYLYQKKMHLDFWKGTSVIGTKDESAKKDFIKVEEKLRDIYENSYPDIPWSEDSAISIEEYNRLDKMTFKTWLDETFGDLHQHIYEYFQKYCWSSFTGSIDELSALQVINFVASEVDGVLALPGGNAEICQTLFEKLNGELGEDKIRSNAFALNVEEKNNQVWVTYYNALKKNLITVSAEKVVIAAPKFVARRIVKNLPTLQEKLMDDISYRGYIVTNAYLKTKIQSPSFDVFSFDGVMPESPAAMKPPKNYMTDICFGSWAMEDRGEKTILTMYRPLAFDGARQFLFSPFAHEKHLKKSREELQDFLQSLNLTLEDVESFRLTRWGHSLPFAATGFLASGLDKKLNAPINGKIFFANQDNYVNPAFECSFQAVLDVVEHF